MPGAGVHPIFRATHHPRAHRIVMQVIDLLTQHLLGNDLLGMKPFLPDLVVASALGRLLVIPQLIQDPGLLILLQPGDKPLGGVALEIPDDIRQFLTRHHQVQMVVQDGLDIDFQALVLAAKPEGVYDNIKIALPSEDGNPLDHRASDEVRDPLSDGIAASHGAGGR